MRIVIDTRKLWLTVIRFAYRRAAFATDEPDGVPGRRSPEFSCDAYEPRKKKPGDWGDCDSDGHYLCRECCHLKEEMEVPVG